MKKFRKLTSAIAALTLVASLAIPSTAMFTAFATGDLEEDPVITNPENPDDDDKNKTSGYSITIKETTPGYEYAAYQIFKGTVATKNGKDELTVKDWAFTVNTDLQTAIAKALGTKAEGSEDVTPATINWTSGTNGAFEVAELLNDDNVDAFIAAIRDTVTKTTAAGTAGAEEYNATTGYTIDLKEAGYYFVVNTTVPTGDYVGTAAILQVAGNAEASPKNSKPSVDKAVYDDDEKDDTPENQSTNETKGAGGYYESADHELYDTFTFQLTATIPADASYAEYKKYAVTFHDTMSKGIAFEAIDSITIADGKGHSVTATVGTNGVTSTASAATLDGTSDDQEWSLSIADLKDEAFSTIELGTSNVTITVVYSAHLTNDAAINAESGDIGNNNTVYLEYSNNPYGEGTGKTAPDEVYVATYETGATKYYQDDDDDNYMQGARFELYKGSTKMSVIWDTKLNAYRPIAEGEKAVDYLVSGGPDSENQNTSYKADDTDDLSNYDFASEDEADGAIKIVGLDEGTYKLVEIKAPAGYNLASDTELKLVVSKHVEDEDLTSGTVTLDENNSGVLKTHIIDLKGSNLPSTGGIGTTLFYVVGGALVAVAGVTLITKKRVGDAE